MGHPIFTIPESSFVKYVDNTQSYPIFHYELILNSNFQIQELFTETKEELRERTVELQDTKETLTTTKRQLRVTVRERDENKHLVGKHQDTESTLGDQAQEVTRILSTCTGVML